MRQSKVKLLAGTSFLALFGAGILLSPSAATAQSLNRAPVVLAQSSTEAKPDEAKSTEAKPDVDKLVPMPEPAKVSPPSIPDAQTGSVPASTTATNAPSAPEVTVVAPADSKAAAETKPEPVAPAATAETPAAPVAATPALSAADQPVADKIKDLLAAKAQKYFDRKGERDGVLALYKDRNYAPLWIEDGKANARASAMVAYLKTVDSDGLDPAEYATPEIKSGADADALADTELKLTNALSSTLGS